MKTAIISVRDTGGTGYTLAHAINNVYPDEHQAINVRGVNNFINYPAICDMNDYKRNDLREICYKSDIIVFLGALAPFYKTFRLRKTRMRDKKKIFLCMGSEWRWGRDKLKKQAEQYLETYKIVLGGADMFIPISWEHKGETHSFPAVDEDEVAYLPVVRSFKDIQQLCLCNQDEKALETFATPKRKVIFTHAPTSEINKGSEMFYKAVTRAQMKVPSLTFQTIQMRPWVTTLQRISKSHVLLDQAPPFPTAYGALSVEAGIFHVPSFSRVEPACQEFIKRQTGLDTPYITFSDEEDLYDKVVTMATSEKHRRLFGDMNYEYCKALHDEKPVVDRFFKIVREMG